MTVSPNDIRMLRLLAAQDQELARLTTEQQRTAESVERSTWLAFIEGQAFTEPQNKSSTIARMWFVAGACGYRAGHLGHDSDLTEMFEVDPSDEFVMLMLRAMKTFRPRPATVRQQHEAADSLGELFPEIDHRIRPDGWNNRVERRDLSTIAAAFWCAAYGWASLRRDCPLLPAIRSTWLTPAELQ